MLLMQGNEGHNLPCRLLCIRVSPKPRGRVTRRVDYASSPSLGPARLPQFALPLSVSPKIYVGMVDRESWPTRVVGPPLKPGACHFFCDPEAQRTLLPGTRTVQEARDAAHLCSALSARRNSTSATSFVSQKHNRGYQTLSFPAFHFLNFRIN